MRMHLDVVPVVEHIVQSTLDIVNAAVRRTTRTGFVQERNLVVELVANERQDAVEKIGQVHFGRWDAGGYRPALRVDRFDDDQIVAQMHAAPVPA